MSLKFQKIRGDIALQNLHREFCKLLPEMHTIQLFF